MNSFKTFPDSKFPRDFRSLIRPSVVALAQRLFILTTERPGSAKYKPTVATFYETGIVLSLYEHILMAPSFSHYEVRIEQDFPSGGRGAPKRVDLWMRQLKGGHVHLVEVGDFKVEKVHGDMRKMIELNPEGKNWFVALFRKGDGTKFEEAPEGGVIKQVIERSLGRSNGLDQKLVTYNPDMTLEFEVYRPDGQHDWFGAAILQARKDS